MRVNGELVLPPASMNCPRQSPARSDMIAGLREAVARAAGMGVNAYDVAMTSPDTRTTDVRADMCQSLGPATEAPGIAIRSFCMVGRTNDRKGLPVDRISTQGARNAHNCGAWGQGPRTWGNKERPAVSFADAGLLPLRFRSSPGPWPLALPPKAAWPHLLDQHARRLLHQLLDSHQEEHRLLTIDDAVV